jgi:hypothetical protein
VAAKHAETVNGYEESSGQAHVHCRVPNLVVRILDAFDDEGHHHIQAKRVRAFCIDTALRHKLR